MADRKKGSAPRLGSATAAYKRELNKLFNQGTTGRQKAVREIRDATSHTTLVKALDIFIKEYDVPDDMELLLRFLDHPSDPLLAKVLVVIETFIDTGKILPKKALYIQKLKGLEFSSFDPRVQSKAIRLAGRL